MSSRTVDDLVGVVMVQLPGGFVGEDQGWAGGEHPRDRDPLRLAARQLLGQLGGQVADARAGPVPRARGSIAASSACPANSSGSATFSVTSRLGSRLGPWNTIPIAAAAAALGASSAGHRTVPAVGASSPAMRCSRVDFPDPDGPVTAMRAQGGIRQFTSRTACTAVGPEPKVRAHLGALDEGRLS